jgi:putative ABC transport system permease protein
VTSYAVTQRVPEIGVRLALGARPRDVFARVLGDGLRLTAIGVVIGGAGALFLAPLLATLLFGVGPADVVTFAVTVAGLLVIAAVATFLPARRATRIDPATALRAE